MILSHGRAQSLSLKAGFAHEAQSPRPVAAVAGSLGLAVVVMSRRIVHTFQICILVIGSVIKVAEESPPQTNGTTVCLYSCESGISRPMLRFGSCASARSRLSRSICL
jgi:hypothetical protein